MKHAGRQLRELLARDGCIVAPGCYDAFTARLVEAVGFDAVYLGGSGIQHCLFGQPSVGYGTLSEYVWYSSHIARAVNIPLVIDAETGFGGALDIRRTVRDLDHAGVAGAHIEDQAHAGGVELGKVPSNLLTIEIAADKIRSARDALGTSDFVLIARTDSAVISVDEMIRRSIAYVQAGADMVFPMLTHFMDYAAHQRGETKGTPYEMRLQIIDRLAREIPAPILIHSPHGTDLRRSDANRLGVKILAIPAMSLASAGPAVLDTLTAYREDRLEEHYRNRPPMPVKDVDARVGMDGYRELVERFGL